MPRQMAPYYTASPVIMPVCEYVLFFNKHLKNKDIIYENERLNNLVNLYKKKITELENKILDEIGTEPSLILRLISKKTVEQDDVNYYHVINKKDNSSYVPKNVSYRITTTILE